MNNLPTGAEFSKNAPWNESSFCDNKAEEIAKDEITDLADEYQDWIADKYNEDTKELDEDEFLTFCKHMAKDSKVVNEYCEYRHDAIVESIDWDDYEKTKIIDLEDDESCLPRNGDRKYHKHRYTSFMCVSYKKKKKQKDKCYDKNNRL